MEDVRGAQPIKALTEVRVSMQIKSVSMTPGSDTANGIVNGADLVGLRM